MGAPPIVFRSAACFAVATSESRADRGAARKFLLDGSPTASLPSVARPLHSPCATPCSRNSVDPRRGCGSVQLRLFRSLPSTARIPLKAPTRRWSPSKQQPMSPQPQPKLSGLARRTMRRPYRRHHRRMPIRATQVAIEVPARTPDHRPAPAWLKDLVAIKVPVAITARSSTRVPRSQRAPNRAQVLTRRRQPLRPLACPRPGPRPRRQIQMAARVRVAAAAVEAAVAAAAVAVAAETAAATPATRRSPELS